MIKGIISTRNNFWNCVCLRYDWRLTKIPSICGCESKVYSQYAMSCKKGGFITIRHNDLRDWIANLLTQVWRDVDIEPQLLPVTGETFENRTANTSKAAKCDIK